MKITKQELMDLRISNVGLERFIQQTNNTYNPVDVASLVGGLSTYSDLMLIAYEKLPRSRTIQLACDCAILNIELIKPYADKYDLIVDFLKNPNKSSRSDALIVRDAVYYAFNSQDAAYNASAYAANATHNATHTAAYAAYNTAVYAATYAFYNAYYSANNAATFAAKISPDAVNKLLIDMFNEVE